jgi:hypothetical protein
MALQTQLTGMTGVYIAAAELSHRRFIVSPTSRGVRGADLLVTDQGCHKAWSVQIKTNAKKRSTWSLTDGDSAFDSNSHLYIFVNLRGGSRPEYIVVTSQHVANKIKRGVNSSRCYFNRGRRST